MSEATFSFDANFISVDSQERGSEFELTNDAGQPSGFFIRLAGPDSERRKRTKERISDFFLANGVLSDGRQAVNAGGLQMLEGASAKLHALHMDDMVAATISWRFPKSFDGPACTPDEVRALYTKHPTIFKKVREAAESLSRFTIS